MKLKIEPVLLSDDDDAVYEFLSTNEHCVVVDWREEETDLIGYVANAIPSADLSVAWNVSEDDLVLSFKDRTLLVGLTFSPRDRYVAIRAVNQVLAGEYEMRLFNLTYESDTLVFYVKTASWWCEAELLHPTIIKRVFRVVDENLDFP